MIALTVTAALGAATAWADAPVAGVLACSSPMAPAPLTLKYDRGVKEIVVREAMVERRQAASFTEDGFQAIFMSPPAAETAYIFTYHGDTGVLNMLSFRPGRADAAEIRERGGTPEGQADLIAKSGKRSMRDVSGALIMTCSSAEH